MDVPGIMTRSVSDAAIILGRKVLMACHYRDEDSVGYCPTFIVGRHLGLYEYGHSTFPAFFLKEDFEFNGNYLHR